MQVLRHLPGRSAGNAMADVESVIDMTALIDRQKVGRFHIRVLLLCGLCCFAAGFYTVALGMIAPVAASALGLGAGALGPGFAAMGLGVLSGSLTCAPLADRFGRRRVVIGGLLLAVPFLSLTATANSLPALMCWLFFDGFALMGVVPIALALAGEFMPRHARVTLTMLVWSGFNFGSIATGIVAAILAAGGHWHRLFFINSVLALAIALIAAFLLPESLDFLVVRHEATRRIAPILQRLAPLLTIPANARFVLEEKEETGFPVSLLFQEGRAGLTLLLWVMLFSNIAVLVFINSWLATILVGMGIGKSFAIIAAASTNAGGIVGGILISELCDHAEASRFHILAGGFLLGGALIAAIGWAGHWPVAAFVAALLVGFFTFGAQNTANAVAATIYPTSMRSTGAGWAIGIGNSSQIFSPLLGGFLLSLQWPVGTILCIAALPTLCATIAALCIAHHLRRRPLAD
jgi:AAHS family 4-hydroxybenzoate transporter-like MFS transporter